MKVLKRHKKSDKSL